jgi:hypothetical protein
VDDILEYKRKADYLIIRVFNDNENINSFKNGVKDALDWFLNIDSSKTAEYLAKFLDFHLKKSSGQTGITDLNLDSLVNEVI